MTSFLADWQQVAERLRDADKDLGAWEPKYKFIDEAGANIAIALSIAERHIKEGGRPDAPILPHPEFPAEHRAPPPPAELGLETNQADRAGVLSDASDLPDDHTIALDASWVASLLRGFDWQVKEIARLSADYARAEDIAKRAHAVAKKAMTELDAREAAARAEEREAIHALVNAQPFYPDTSVGMRQQWVKDQIAAAIRARRKP